MASGSVNKKGSSKVNETLPAVDTGARKRIAKPPREGSHPNAAGKLTPAAVQFILDMTVSGYSNQEILQALKTEFKVTVTETILYYHRNKNADKLAQSYQAELETARARTNLSFLSRRIAVADELIKKEVKKKKPSLYGVATLLSAADTAIHRAELRKMKYEEIARRYKEGGDTQKDEILAALERRTALIHELEKNEAEMLAIVEADFEIMAPRELESTKQAALPAPEHAAVIPEGGDDDDSDAIGEDALLA